MADPASGLLIELKALRKGRGVFTPQLSALVGPCLRTACDIAPTDDVAAVRQKLISHLSRFAATLPEDLGLAAAAALAVHPDARQTFLRERIRWLAERISRDDRTARRRIEIGIIQLAEVATGGVLEQTAAPTYSDDWYVTSLRSVVVLDRKTPESFETRRIVAASDAVDHLMLAVSLPRDPLSPDADHDLEVTVLYGGTLVRRDVAGTSQFRFELQLPRPLRSGERHEFAIQLRVPDSQSMRTHYVHTSPRRCDSFDLRIRFGRDHVPKRVWRVDGLFHRELDELRPAGELLDPDVAGDLHLEFTTLAPGYAYGVQWCDEKVRPPR